MKQAVKQILSKTSYGPLLREIREARGLSTTEVAYELRVVASAVQNYEAGRREPDGFTLLRYASMAREDLRKRLEEFIPEDVRALVTYQKMSGEAQKNVGRKLGAGKGRKRESSQLDRAAG